MAGPLITYPDAELAVVGYLRTVLPELTPAGYKIGTKVAPGVTPTRYVQVRQSGGDDLRRVAARPRVDVRVWSDGADDNESMANARHLHARARQRFSAVTFAAPVQLPDPADNTRNHVLFTIELLLRGVQSA